MQKAIIAGAIAIAVATIASFAAGGAKMKITSSAFQEGSDIPSKFSRDGGNHNPPLRLEGTPTHARSLTLPPPRLNFRSAEHTSELQSQSNLVCRLLPPKTILSLLFP